MLLKTCLYHLNFLLKILTSNLRIFDEWDEIKLALGKRAMCAISCKREREILIQMYNFRGKLNRIQVAGLSDVFGSAQTHFARALNFVSFRTDHSLPVQSIIIEIY